MCLKIKRGGSREGGRRRMERGGRMEGREKEREQSIQIRNSIYNFYFTFIPSQSPIKPTALYVLTFQTWLSSFLDS